MAGRLDELRARYDCGAVILSTCNRVELYLARPGADIVPDADLMAEFLSEIHAIPADQVRQYLYEHRDADAVRHLLQVTSSLDSLVIGEGQIAGQVRQAYETAAAHENGAGPLLHLLFQHAARVAKRVRTETGISRGKVSVSSAAVDYVREVFSHFDDKTILVIGAGKMGELTLKHLRQLAAQAHPGDQSQSGKSRDGRRLLRRQARVPWADLEACGGTIRADIVLSTTGAPQPIVTDEQLAKGVGPAEEGIGGDPGHRGAECDFDPRIHDGDRTCLFNIDDLKAHPRRHLGGASEAHRPGRGHRRGGDAAASSRTEARRRIGPMIDQLVQKCNAMRARPLCRRSATSSMAD